MTARSYARLSAVIFAVAAVLQLMRDVAGWPVTVEMGGGPISIPLWPNWIACAAFALLAWLGIMASQS